MIVVVVVVVDNEKVTVDNEKIVTVDNEKMVSPGQCSLLYPDKPPAHSRDRSGWLLSIRERAATRNK